ncbi:MAG: MFS transporter [Phycisphaerae bacterium]|jgi:GPH family glycoside/pentoside/hexuronide:cation symporter
MEKCCPVSEAKPPEKSNQVSFFEKVAYGFGGGGEVLMANLLFLLAYPIYQAGLGVDARWLGWAIGIPRLWDAVIDPFIGNMSDNAKTRWGRRKPFMFVGAIATGIFCMLLWMPPANASKLIIFAYFFVFSMLYFTSYAWFAIPWNGLGYELSSDYDERINVMSFKVFLMSAVGTLLIPLALPMCFWFGHNKIEGVRVVGMIFGAFIILFGIVPALFCKERIHKEQQKILLKDAFKYTFKNKPFMIACGVILFTVLGIYVSIPLQYYINMSYVLPGNEGLTAKFLMYCSYTSGIVGFLCVPIINLLSHRYGKKLVLQAGLLFVIAGTLLSWVFYTPNHPYLQLATAFIISPGWICVFLILAAIVADICDLDELTTNRRREGMFGAIFNLFLKVGVALTMVVSGYVISWTGYDSARPIQLASTIFKIRFMFAIVPLGVLAIALVCTFMYPLTKQKVLEIRSALDARENARINAGDARIAHES